MANTLKVTTPSDREVQMTRIFDAPRNLVFDCWTKPELIKRWMTGPDGWSFAVCEIDLKVGGAYRFVWRNRDGAEMAMQGRYMEIVPVERLVNTEAYDEDWTGGETIATAVFTEQGGKTTVTSTVLYASKAARDRALNSGMENGVAASYDRLEEILVSVA